VMESIKKRQGRRLHAAGVIHRSSRIPVGFRPSPGVFLTFTSGLFLMLLL
jgi:hypothetical protein